MKFVLKPISIVVLALCFTLGFTPESRAAYLNTESPRPVDRVGDYHPPRPRYADNPVTRLVEQIEVGRPCQYRNLTIYPLLRRSAREFTDIKTLDEAVDNHWIIIREKDQSMVSEVTVRNESRHYVFLMAGELLVGGKQNRFIRDDVLLPPYSRDIDVPVYCSEKERWTTRTDGFDSPKCLAQTELRCGAARGVAQQDIWSAVDSQSEKAKVNSPTRDYYRVYESPSLKRELDEYADHFRDVRRAETVGAVAVVGGRILSCDFFSDPTLCSRLWNKLVRAHALDAIYRPADERGALTEHDIRHYLEAIFTARYEGQHGADVGELLRISGSVEGMALIWEGRVVHAVLFGECRIKDVSPIPTPDPVLPWRLKNDAIWR